MFVETPENPTLSVADIEAITGDPLRFVDLGGDSLSYVEVSLRLEELLGHLHDLQQLLKHVQRAQASPRLSQYSRSAAVKSRSSRPQRKRRAV